MDHYDCPHVWYNNKIDERPSLLLGAQVFFFFTHFSKRSMMGVKSKVTFPEVGIYKRRFYEKKETRIRPRKKVRLKKKRKLDREKKVSHDLDKEKRVKNFSFHKFSPLDIILYANRKINAEFNPCRPFNNNDFFIRIFFRQELRKKKIWHQRRTGFSK